MISVIGAGGFIGSHLVRSLTAAGVPCRGVLRGDPGLWELDLGDAIYAVGLTADFRTRPHDTIEAHVGLLNDVLRRSRFDSLLYLSSTRVYGRQADTRENAALSVRPEDPSDLYNLSKLTGEALCLADRRATVRVARISNVFGANDVSENFLTSVLRDALRGEVVLRTADDSSKDYISVNDVVALLPRIATRGLQRLYNVAAGTNTTHRELLTELTRVTGCSTRIAPGSPSVILEPIHVERITSEFGHSASTVLHAIPELVAGMSKA